MPSTPVLVDAHVHYHRSFERDAFLDHAADAFAAAARALGLPPATPGALLLTEIHGSGDFVRLRQAPAGRWKLVDAEAGLSVIAGAGDARPTMAIVAGRQIVTAERLEVLALACAAEIADGLDVDRTIAAVGESGGVPVLPWGVGKWWGARGELVLRRVERARPGELYLGDNGGRPAAWPRPPLFSRAERRGLHVLAGSDPLPFPREMARIGRHGFALDFGWNPAAPAATLRTLLTAGSVKPRTYGAGISVAAMLWNQAALRLGRRSEAVSRRRPAS